MNSYYVCMLHHGGKAVMDGQTFPRTERGKADALKRAEFLRRVLSLPAPVPGHANNAERESGQRHRELLGIPRGAVRVEAIHYRQLG